MKTNPIFEGKRRRENEAMSRQIVSEGLMGFKEILIMNKQNFYNIIRIYNYKNCSPKCSRIVVGVKIMVCEKRNLSSC